MLLLNQQTIAQYLHIVFIWGREKTHSHKRGHE